MREKISLKVTYQGVWLTRLPTLMSAAQVWLLLQRVFISKHSLTNKSNYLTSVTFAELTKEGLHKNQKM